MAVSGSKERFFSHNQVRTEFAAVLHVLVKTNRLGRFVTDGMLLSNVEADRITNSLNTLREQILEWTRAPQAGGSAS